MWRFVRVVVASHGILVRAGVGEEDREVARGDVQAQAVSGLDAVARVAEVDLGHRSGARLVDDLAEQQRVRAAVGVDVDELDVEEQRGRIARELEVRDDSPGERHRLVPAARREREHVGPRLDRALVRILVERGERVDERRGHEVARVVHPRGLGALARDGHERPAGFVRDGAPGLGEIQPQLGGGRAAASSATPASRGGGRCQRTRGTEPGSATPARNASKKSSAGAM